MIQIRVSVSGQLRTIDTMAKQLSDLTLPMELWNKYKRKEVQRIFSEGGPGWPAKKSGGGDGGGGSDQQSASADEALKAKADAILRVKLKAELRRAQRRHARGRGNESRSAASVARRYAVLQAFEKLAAGQKIEAEFTDARLAKSVIGLHERHRRATAKAASRPLGRVAQSIKSKVEKSAVTIYSGIPWAGVHNKGGTAGHGAEIPKRQFLDVTDADVSVLLMLITMHVQGR